MLVIPANLESYRTLKDRTLKLVFETGELSPDQIAELHHALMCAGFLAFNPDPFTKDQERYIAELESDYDDPHKTPSKRLRGVLYRNFEQDGEKFKTFEDYYRSKMEILIEHFKKKLDETI